MNTAARSGRDSSPRCRTAQVMGTVASIHVYDRVSTVAIDAAIDDSLDEIERIEQMFSTFRPDSAVSLINADRMNLLDAPGDVIEVLDACTWLEHASSGAFSFRRPDGRLDPAGFVKGWAAERGAARLAEYGIDNFTYTVGGDLIARGEPAPGQRWHVAIADPLSTGHVARSVEIRGGAVATSGTSERGNHIRLRHDHPQLASFTVLGPSLTWADAFATAAFAMGPAGLAWVAQFVGYEGIAIDVSGAVANTDGFAVRAA